MSFFGFFKHSTGSSVFIIVVILAILVGMYFLEKTGYADRSAMTNGVVDPDDDPDYDQQSPFTNGDFESDPNPDYDQQSPFTNNQTTNIDSYASATGIQSSIIQPPMGDNRPKSIQDPSELLPRNEGSSQWSVLAPSGQGELSNINLLKAGYHAGINTIGTSLRNANQQLRSEPPNPQTYTGPWNISTITQDAVRRPTLEIGQGPE